MAKRRFTTIVRLGAVSTLTIRAGTPDEGSCDLTTTTRQDMVTIGQGVCDMLGIVAAPVAPKKARRPWRGPRRQQVAA